MIYIYIALGVFFFLGISIAGSASSYFVTTVRIKEGVMSSVNLPAADLAKDVLFRRNIKVKVIKSETILSDHYSSKNKTLAISSPFYLSTSVVALGITAHELGHAITDSERNSIFVFHQTLAKICVFLNRFFLLILAATIALFFFREDLEVLYNAFFLASVVIIALSFLLKFITVSNEKAASNIGLTILKEYGMTAQEIKTVKRIYRAALITYIGAIFMPFVKIIDFILMIISKTLGRVIK